MKDLKKLAYECEQDLLSIGIQPGRVNQWIVDTQVKCRWGLCAIQASGLYDISISVRLLQDDADEQAVKNVILHELLHTVDGCRGHRGKWKELAEKVNRDLPQYTIKRGASEAEFGLESTYGIRTNKYLVKCSKCGNEYYREKKSKLIQQPERYRCGKCGSPLVRVK